MSNNIIKAKYVVYDETTQIKQVNKNTPVHRKDSAGVYQEVVDIANVEKIRILLEAENEAIAKTNKMIEEAIEIAEDIKKKAYEEGYSNGFKQGKDDGYENGKEIAYMTLKEENEETVAELVDIIKLIENEKQYIINDYENNLKYLALGIAEKIVKQELVINENVILSIVENAIQEYKNVDWIKIHIPLSDKTVDIEMDNKLIEILKRVSEDIKIERTKDLGIGDCKIETPDSIVDVGVNTQLENLKSVVHDIDEED